MSKDTEQATRQANQPHASNAAPVHPRTGWRDSVWSLAIPPAVWAVHFLLSYLTAAIYCAKVATESGPSMTVQLMILGYTLLAMPLLWVCARPGMRDELAARSNPTYDEDTSQDRHRFLAFSQLLLASLSAVATLFTAMAAIFAGGCS